MRASGQWALAILLYKAVYILHAWGQGLPGAIQLYNAIQYTAIHRYTLYTLYSTPLVARVWWNVSCGVGGGSGEAVRAGVVEPLARQRASRAKRRSVAIHGRCRRCRWEVATSILLPAPSPLPAFCASPRAFRGSQFSPFPVRKPFLYVRSRGVALGEQRWRRRGAPIRTRGAVQRSRVRWERGDNGATCPAHRPWPAKHAASSPHPPSVRSPECFIAGPRWALYTPL